MLPYATPPICARLDPYEERDTLRTQARRQLAIGPFGRSSLSPRPTHSDSYLALA
jgi:hypothetical protein